MIDDNEFSYSFDRHQIRIDYTSLTPRFTVKDADSLHKGINHLNEHGYTIFSDIMDENEINMNKDLLWQFLENIPGRHIQRNDPTTWSNNWPGNGRFGTVDECGIGQSDFMWNIRSNRNIKHVYSQIWNSNELLVSFEGCGLFRNWYCDPSWKTISGWYHVDQNPIARPDRCSMQGFVSLTNQNEKTGGLIVFPHTHLRFHELTDIVRREKDFVPVPSHHSVLDRGRAIGKFIQCQAGDLVVWDSRLIHCNSPAFIADEELKKQSMDFLRIVAYISMTPTTFVRDCTIDQLRKKRKLAVQNNATLTHWGAEIIESNPNSNMVLPKISIDKLNPYQRSLIIGTNLDDDE